MAMEMIHIDGSEGEGGGQILRTALSLSMVTGIPFRISGIRAGRAKPGLLRQHRTCVAAAQEISSAELTGNDLGSMELSFHPDKVRGGDYRFAIGSAGSTSLVLQTVLPALALAAGRSQVTLQGGTHNPSSPSFDYLQTSFFPLLAKMDVEVSATLDRYGFAPAGGGQISLHIQPAPQLLPVHLAQRLGAPKLVARAYLSNVPEHVAERELKTLRHHLDLSFEDCHVMRRLNSLGPGNALVVEVQSENICECFTAFGERNVSAEQVAISLSQEVNAYIDAKVPVGPHMADQLLLWMAMAGEGSMRTQALTQHSLTQIEIIGRFLQRKIDVHQEGEDRVLVRVTRA